MSIYDYIDIMNDNGLYGGEIEIHIAKKIYKINIATYKEIYSNFNNEKLIGLKYINYYNYKDNNRNLLILININNIHYNLAYDKDNDNIIDTYFIMTDSFNKQINSANEIYNKYLMNKNNKNINNFTSTDTKKDKKIDIGNINIDKICPILKKYNFQDISKKI